MNVLTIDETIAVMHLKNAKGDTAWHEAFKLAFKQNTPEVFKVLIQQLNSQIKDNPKMAEKMFGTPLCNAVKRCFYKRAEKDKVYN